MARCAAALALLAVLACVAAADNPLLAKPSAAELRELASQWTLRITNPIAHAWVSSSLLNLGFTGSVSTGTDTTNLQICVSVDGGAPSCMAYQDVMMTGMSEGAHSVVVCWRIPGFGSCFDYAFTAREMLEEEVPGRDQVSFVVVHPFAHSAVQWAPNLGSPLPYSV